MTSVSFHLEALDEGLGSGELHGGCFSVRVGERVAMGSRAEKTPRRGEG